MPRRSASAPARPKTFGEKGALSPQQVELTEVRQQCDVFFIGAEMGKMVQDGAAAFAWG